MNERAKISQNLVLYTVTICYAAPNVRCITAHANRCPHRTCKASRLATGHTDEHELYHRHKPNH